MNDQPYCVTIEFLMEGKWWAVMQFRNPYFATRLIELCFEEGIACRLTYVPTGNEKEQGE